MTILTHTILSNIDSSLLVTMPKKQLLHQSVKITAKEQQFHQLSETTHKDAYFLMKRIAQTWENNNITDQYLIYSKIDCNQKKVKSFKMEMVPYQKCKTSIGRIVQQLQVLWRITFGGTLLSETNRTTQIQTYQKMLFSGPKNSSSEELSSTEELDEEKKSDDSDMPTEITSELPKILDQGSDVFCKNETIDRQYVLRGKTVNALFTHAPIGFGGERLHFLIIPHKHRETFTDLTKEEYLESLELAQQLVDHFTKTRDNIEFVYIITKTGLDAGQTIKHWHLHIIFSTNKAQDFFGKITVMKNIMLGSSPMKKNVYEETVEKLRNELETSDYIRRDTAFPREDSKTY